MRGSMREKCWGPRLPDLSRGPVTVLPQISGMAWPVR